MDVGGATKDERRRTASVPGQELIPSNRESVSLNLAGGD
jgi:hypothetical protein